MENADVYQVISENEFVRIVQVTLDADRRRRNTFPRRCR